MEIEIIKLKELLEDKKWQTRYNALASLIKLKDNSALERVKRILYEDDNEHVREIAVEYLRLNNSFPINPINAEDINLYPFPIVNKHTVLDIIHVASDSNLLSENEAKEDIKYKLKHEAMKLGANAVIRIECGRKFLSRQFKAKGYAVIITDNPEKVRFKIIRH